MARDNPNGGRPRYQRNETDRKLVWALAACGRPQDEIARYLKISDVTLRRYFRYELDTAATEATLAVEQSVHWMATRGRNLAAAQFWLRNRAKDRWGEGRDTPGRTGEEAAPAIITFQWAETDPSEPPAIEGETK